MSDHVPSADGRCVCIHDWRDRADDGTQQAVGAGYWVEWLTPLLTEASGAAHGHLNIESLRRAIRAVPPPFLRRAGLVWAMPESQEQDADADAAASPVLTARVYAADSARTVPGTSACCEGE